MRDPFEPTADPMVIIAHAAMPILVDRLGGTVTLSHGELAALSSRYGGAVAVAARQIEPGVYRLSLVSTKQTTDSDTPLS